MFVCKLDTGSVVCAGSSSTFEALGFLEGFLGIVLRVRKTIL
jgi:hypothetical protein